MIWLILTEWKWNFPKTNISWRRRSWEASYLHWYTLAGALETILQGFPSLQGEWEPEGTSCLPRRVRSVGLRPSRRLSSLLGSPIEPPAAALLSLSLMLTCSGLLTDRRPCARSSRLLRNLSRSSTSRNRKKTSLHSGWVSNNLQSDTRRTEFTHKHPTAGAHGHVTSVARVCSSLRQFILPQVFWAEIWLSPLHPILLLVICNQPVDIFFPPIFLFCEPPQQEPPGLWSDSISPLTHSPPLPQSVLSHSRTFTLCCHPIRELSCLQLSRCLLWPRALHGPGVHACYKLRLFALNLV